MGWHSSSTSNTPSAPGTISKPAPPALTATLRREVGYKLTREMKRLGMAVSVGAAVVTLGNGVSGATGASREAELVSRAQGPAGAAADGPSSNPAISASGRFVAFATTARNLAPEDGDEFSDVYVRDRELDTTTLVSRASGVAGAKGNGGSGQPAISADGRFVAFFSEATNLTPESSANQIYVRDLIGSTTVLASRAPGLEGAPGNGISTTPAISADGSTVAFASLATNLAPDGTATSNVYVRDLGAETTELVSRRSGNNGAPGQLSSNRPSISADGTRVAFDSSAPLHPDDDSDEGAVYVRDRTTDRTVLAGRASGRNGRPSSFSGSAAISGNGNRVAFISYHPKLDPGRRSTLSGSKVYVRSLESQKTKLASRGIRGGNSAEPKSALEPRISRDGRRVTFVATFTASGDREPKPRMYLAPHRGAGSRLIAGVVSRDAEELDPALSADGRVLAFSSEAAEQTTGADGVASIYALVLPRR